MANKKDNDLLGGIALAFVGVVAAWQWLMEHLALGLAIIVIIVGIIVAYYRIRSAAEKKRLTERRQYLLQKYNNPELVEKIMAGEFWKKQTAEQLRDSLGTPIAIDKDVSRSKKREVWKYQHVRGDQYKLRITLDQDEVSGWTQRA